MDEEIILSQIREFNHCLKRDFPQEHFGIADKLILSNCVRGEVKYYEKYGQAHNIRSTNFIKGVMLRMRDMGYKPDSELLDIKNNYFY